jgi:Family of unknown function (DUF5329)
MHFHKMGLALTAGLTVLLASFLSQGAVAAPPEIAVREINHLLERVAESGCEFYRNGIWFKGNLGQAHLRDKYEYLAKRDMISAATDFIDKAASQSSMSGLAYRVRCNGQEEMLSKQWLTEELMRYRAAVH